MKVGEKIKCKDTDDMISRMRELSYEGIETEYYCLNTLIVTEVRHGKRH